MQTEAKIIQRDVRHKCAARTWECLACDGEYCMAEQPKYCPECGAMATSVILKLEPEQDTLSILNSDIENELTSHRKKLVLASLCLLAGSFGSTFDFIFWQSQHRLISSLTLIVCLVAGIMGAIAIIKE